MSLFSKSQPTENSGPLSFKPEEAVIALLFLAVTSDGKMSESEEEIVIAASDRMKLLRNLSIDDFNDVVYKVRQAIEGSGRDAVFEAGVKGTPDDLRDTVYALSADVVYSNGSACELETNHLRKTQEALQISDDLASKIVEVIRIKNRG